MLVLTRDFNEEIVLTIANKKIVIAYLGNDEYGEARIGIKADRDVDIVRAELLGKPKKVHSH